MSASTAAPRPSAPSPLRRHLGRALGRDRNPLCRPVDRARSRLLLALWAGVVLAAVAGTVVALALLGVRRAEAQRAGAHLHQVTATVTGRPVADSTDAAAAASAAWSYPGADRHSGTVSVPGDAAAGSRVPVWVGDSGSPAGAPPTETAMVTGAALDGTGAALLVAVAAQTGYLLRRRALDRRAERAWEPDWAQVEPFWSGRVR
ncbi:hypothetical protein ACFYNO_22110 [Kitasatospora sp. NPDC006697]|uniref:Rv1733c family protein n=1 Tax=Kitasatospora sp. NPDC006697 TaxID=3364020 RepID=UPI0036B698AC